MDLVLLQWLSCRSWEVEWNQGVGKITCHSAARESTADYAVAFPYSRLNSFIHSYTLIIHCEAL